MNFDQACDVICMVSKQYRSGCFIEQVFYNILDDTKNYVVCRNNAKIVKLKVHVLQLLNVYKSHNIMYES